MPAHAPPSPRAVLCPAVQAALRPEAGSAGEEHIVRTRTYDLLISYDKFYQASKRVAALSWLRGAPVVAVPWGHPGVE